MIKVRSVSVTYPKAGNCSSENEDTFWPAYSHDYGSEVLRFAVTDGATEGMRSDEWGRQLAKHIVRQWPEMLHLDQWLQHVCGDWLSSEVDFKRKREAQNRPIQWYEEPGLQTGAFAALVGISLYASAEGHPGQFEAVALGDSCFFLIRENRLLFRFPLQSAAEFSNWPVLLASNPARNNQIREYFRFAHGDLCTGDCLYLMTDKLAEWFLRQHESGGSPWLDLDRYGNRESFWQWIDLLREKKQIKNDDVTLTSIRIINL